VVKISQTRTMLSDSMLRRGVSGLALALFFVAGAHAQTHHCGNPFQNHFGPFDYRTATAKQKLAVESVHYTAEIQQMKAGGTTTNLAGDLAYTLRVFPNHHGALKTMSDWSVRTKRNPARGGHYTVECWFDRALRFRPDDAMVKMLFGVYLLQVGKSKEAVEHLEQARKEERRNANLHYNLGLAYVRLGRYGEALESAHIAYGLGFPLPGLRNQLVKAGKWRDPLAPSAQQEVIEATEQTEPVVPAADAEDAPPAGTMAE